MMDEKIIVATLQEIAKKHKMTLMSAAAEAGISKDTVATWLRRSALPTVEEINKIADHLEEKVPEDIIAAAKNAETGSAKEDSKDHKTQTKAAVKSEVIPIPINKPIEEPEEKKAETKKETAKEDQTKNKAKSDAKSDAKPEADSKTTPEIKTEQEKKPEQPKKVNETNSASTDNNQKPVENAPKKRGRKPKSESAQVKDPGTSEPIAISNTPKTKTELKAKISELTKAVTTSLDALGKFTAELGDEKISLEKEAGNKDTVDPRFKKLLKAAEVASDEGLDMAIKILKKWKK